MKLKPLSRVILSPTLSIMDIQLRTTTKLSRDQIRTLDDHLKAAIARGEWLSLVRYLYTPHYYAVARQLHAGRGVIALALDRNEIIGSMYAYFPRFPSMRLKAKFHKLMVLPEYRGQGIATLLFSALETEAKKAGRQEIWFYHHRDNPARALYNKLGYSEAKKHHPLRVWIRVEKIL